MIAIFLDGHPPTTTAQQTGIKILRSKSTGRHVPLHYKKEKVEAAIAWFVSRLAPYSPRNGKTVAFEVHVPLRLEVVFVFNWNKPELKKRKAGLLTECWWKTTKPDAGNATKLVSDVLTAQGFWADDAQVCVETTSKVFGDRPGVFVSIEALKPHEAMPPPWFAVKL